MDRADLASRTGAARAFVALLVEAGTPLPSAALRQRLIAHGVDPDSAAVAWRRAQPALRRSGVSYDPVRGTYRYGDTGPANATPGPDEALDRLLPARLTSRRADLAAIVRAALKDRDDLETRLRAGYDSGRALRVAQDRRAQIEAVRALSDVVAEVEELAAAGVDVTVMAERVRALAHAFGLAPIGRAGESTPFDPAWHAPIGVRPPDGSPVTVVRPGYTWPVGSEVVLIDKAQVAWLARPT